MAYSILGIVNLALGKIGAKEITAFDNTTPNGKAAGLVWEYIRDEVLEVRDWRFAKTRALMGTGTEVDDTEEYGFDYAYQMPSDFLRLPKRTVNSFRDDPPVYPQGYDYKIEVVTITDTGPPETTSDVLCLLTDYDNSTEDMFITYIKKQTDPTMYSAAFINALAFRLAAELALKLSGTGSLAVYNSMMQLYEAALRSADGITESHDFEEDEQGSDEWLEAGR
jgi:hypothetical protein